VYEHLNGAVVVQFGPHEVARFEASALPAPQPKRSSSPQPQTGGGGMKGTGAWFNLEAPPPNLRDLPLLGPECTLWRRGRCAAPANRTCMAAFRRLGRCSGRPDLRIRQAGEDRRQGRA
jgi:hypothetical protein